MPVYELRCEECQHTFEVLTPTMTLPKETVCPQCGGQEVRRLLSSFFSRSAQKAKAAPEACEQCPGRGKEAHCPFSAA
ncbi:MAG: zinc ribbon domain-containing protein [Armatimonadetes bacterium]|jgi:putative FmdB family regulatory protein|nr:zinc ribbon domain-containing protein [Armatimonadota bacterium]